MKKKTNGILKAVRCLWLPSLIALGLIITIGCTACVQKGKTLVWKPGTTVTTLYGKIKGYESSQDTYGWKAIPYARPPVGELRWKAPQNPNPWNDVYDATVFCEKCPQFTRDASSIVIVGKEDCLYLNIWRPKSKETGLPVYLWIHGGGNSVFTASADRLDGTKMAGKSKIVIVTINYRLGPMGWFTHPALRHGKNVKDDSGNYGTLDILKALEWVRDNIEAFGGDPGNVTIAGESAGAKNVITLLISPLAAGLFHKAIAESCGGETSPITNGDTNATAVIDRLLKNDGTVTDSSAAKIHREKMSNADIERYLRSKTVEALLKGHDMLFGPMIKFPNCFTDGAVIHKEGLDALNEPNKYNQVPIILGSNKEEMKLFMGLGPYFSQMDPATYQQVTQTKSDEWKLKAVDNIAKKLAAHDSQPGVYAYQFNYGAYNPDGYNAWPTNLDGVNYALKFGASHALEISFFWGNRFFFGLEKIIFREDNRKGYEALTNSMMSYVAQFVRTGKPGAVDGIFWNPWSDREGESKRISFDANNTEARIEMSKE